MKKKVLVCGATGFIGRNVAEALKDKYDITGTYLRSPPWEGIEMVQADLRKEEDVKRVVEGKDVIIQMAATTSGANDILNRPYIHVTDNAVMNSLLLRSVFDSGVPQFIFPSCTVMYQPTSGKLLKEEDFNPSEEIFKSYFGVGNTKVYIEKMCEFFSRLGKTKHTVIRHSNVYGPHDKYDLERSHVFGATVTKVMNAKDSITVWGDGKEERDLLYVNDLVSLIDSAIEKQQTPYELVNAGMGKSVPIKDLVSKIINASGKDLEIKYDTTKPSIKTRVALDCSKAYEKFGWQPQTSLDEGIKKTLDWYKSNIQI